MRKKTKILLVTNNAPPVRGGSSVVYAGLAQHANGEIILLAPKRNYLDGLPLIGWREHDLKARYPVFRLDLLRTPIGGPRGRGVVRRWLFVLNDAWIRLRVVTKVVSLLLYEPIGTICIGELVPSAWLLMLLRWWPGLRRAVYIHGEEITATDNYDPDRARRRRGLGAAGLIIVVSQFTSEAVRRLMDGVNLTTIKLIENGVDSARFAPAPRRTDLKSWYGLEEKFVFLAVCRLLEKKGVDQAMRAFSSLYGHTASCCFLIVGFGPFAEALVQLAGELSISDRVIFAGDVPDDELAAHFHLADVFVMPNRALSDGDTEGFGLVFLEANAAGLPVIAGQDGGSVDAVKHGLNGLVVDGRSVEAIADAMRLLHDDEMQRAALAARGLAHAAAMDWRYKAVEFLQVCNGNGNGAIDEL